MKFQEFINKFKSRFLWANLAAMCGVVFALVIGVSIALNYYTHHGESIAVPDVRNKSIDEAAQILEEAGLAFQVTDTGYVKSLPADYVLEQTPAADSKVKSGHIIRLIVNTSSTPSLALPDIADNCSVREALAKLKAMGFKVGTPQYVDGEKDWVYGVTVDGKKVMAGDRILINKTVILQVGSGSEESDDSLQFIDYSDEEFSGFDTSDEFDGFIEVQ